MSPARTQRGEVAVPMTPSRPVLRYRRAVPSTNVFPISSPADRAHAPAPSISRSRYFWILPVAVRGNSSTKRIVRGHL